MPHPFKDHLFSGGGWAGGGGRNINAYIALQIYSNDLFISYGDFFSCKNTCKLHACNLMICLVFVCSGL